MFTAMTNVTQPPIQVRLVNGENENEGRVEIFYAGLWGTICEDFFSPIDLRSADVICRQLGYPGALRVARYNEFGRGTGQVWLTNLQCTGNETLLEQCSHSGFGSINCYFFSQDIGVECQGMLLKHSYAIMLLLN